MNKILICLQSKYPTNKAYGVTTRYTARELTSLGFDVSILAKSSVNFDESENQIINNYNIKLNFLQKFPKTQFTFATILTFFKIINLSFRSEGKIGILWVRDPILACAALLNKKIDFAFIEIHHIPQKLRLIVLKYIMNFKKIQIGAITPNGANTLNKLKPSKKIHLTQMAIPNEFITQAIPKKKIFSGVIGFIGKATSSGVDNGLIQLITDFVYCKRNGQNIKLILIGIEDNFREVLINSFTIEFLKKTEVEILGHLSHDQILEFIDTIDVGVVPYPENDYHAQRFPIKILELASRKVALLLSDTAAHRDLLNDDLALFYIPGKPDTLFNGISNCIFNDSSQNDRIIAAWNWARSHTYRQRVASVIEELSHKEHLS